MKINRRTFVAFAGAASASAVLPLPARSSDGCTAPYASGTHITPWRSPGSSVVNRVNVNALSNAHIATLRRAYSIMKGLPSSDPRSMDAQRNLHAWYCASCDNVTVPDIHGHWTFMPWHRAFLYFHERILASLADDPMLRLPYWGWEDPSGYPFPSVYGDASSPLHDALRTLKTGDSVDRQLGPYPPYDFSDVARLIAGDFQFLAGSAGAGGGIENGSHGYVHVSTGGARQFGDPVNGDMSSLNTAARDPVFFAHHGNIDRIWYSWQRVGGHSDPSGSFRALSFTFYDPAQKWVTIQCADLIDTHNLGYAYDQRIAPASLRGATPFALHLSSQGVVGAPSNARSAIAAARQATLSLVGLEIDGEGAFTVSVLRGSTAHVLGELFVTLHRMESPMTRIRRANIQLHVPPAAAQAVALGSAQLTVKASRPPQHHGQLLQFQFSAPQPARVEHLSISIPTP